MSNDNTVLSPSLGDTWSHCSQSSSKRCSKRPSCAQTARACSCACLGVCACARACLCNQAHKSHRHLWKSFQSLLRVLIPEVEGTVRSCRAERTVLGMENDAIHGVDVLRTLCQDSRHTTTHPCTTHRAGGALRYTSQRRCPANISYGSYAHTLRKAVSAVL